MLWCALMMSGLGGKILKENKAVIINAKVVILKTFF
jgi:hypothetical protein